MSGSVKITAIGLDLPQCNGRQHAPGTEFISVLNPEVSAGEVACNEGTSSPTRILIEGELFLDPWPG